MGTPATVPPHVQLAVKEMNEEMDKRGRKLWSYAAIAKALGLSETTVYRIINGLGAYQGADRLKVGKELTEDIAASMERFAQMQKEQAAQPEKKDEPKPADKPKNKYGF